MLTLSLLRHAKSDWADTDLSDLDRPLARRGEEAAPRMGAFMAARGIKPDLVLCSGAARTRATWAMIEPRLGLSNAEVSFENALYLASERQLLKRIRQLKTGVRHALVIGHNPGLHDLAMDLAGEGEEAAMQALAAKFPTCGLAVLTFDTLAWSGIGPGRGRLALFTGPRLIE